MLCLADIEGRSDQDACFVARALCDHFGADGIGTEKSIWPVLLGRPDRNDDCLRLLKIGFDLRPGREMELHVCPSFGTTMHEHAAQGTEKIIDPPGGG